MKLIFALCALEILNISLHIPVFGPFIRGLGASHFFLGVMNSSQAFISLLWNPVIGSLSDAQGRKHLLINCMIASLIGNLLMSCTTSLPLLFIARLICGFGSPVIILLRTIVTDLSKSQDEKNSAFGKIGILQGLMFISGTLLSGFISEAKNGVTIVYLMMAVGSLIGIALATQLPDDRKAKSKKSKTETSIINSALNEIKSASANFINLDWKRYWDIFAIKLLSDFGFGVFVANIGLLLSEEFNIVGRKLGILFMTISICSMAANILKMRLKKYLPDSDRTKIAYSILILSVSFLGIGLATSFFIFMVFVGVMGVGRALNESNLTDAMTSKATGEDKGKVISAFDNLMPLAQFAAPLVSGILADQMGERNTILLSIIPLGAALSVAYNIKKEDVKKE